MELEKLKRLLGITDESRDAILAFIISDVEETICNYCNIKMLPSGLLNTAYRMAMDLHRNENIGQEDVAVGAVSSLSEGDTSTSFSQYVDDHFRETILKDYRPALNRYRKVGFK